MNPTLTIDLDVVRANARALSARLRASGIELVGVTKAVDGEPAVGQALLEGGCVGLADSRLPAMTRLAARALGPLTFIRAPQPDEVETVAQITDRVHLSRPEIARALGERAPGDPIEVLLTVDLGDRREGVLPEHAAAVAAELGRLPRSEPRRHRGQLRLPLGTAPQPRALRARRGDPRGARGLLRRRAAPLAGRDLLPAVRRRLPAALSHRGALRRRAVPRLGHRLGLTDRGPRAARPGAHRDRPRMLPQAAGSRGPPGPRRLRARARRAASAGGRLVRSPLRGQTGLRAPRHAPPLWRAPTSPA